MTIQFIIIFYFPTEVLLEPILRSYYHFLKMVNASDVLGIFVGVKYTMYIIHT